MNSSKIKIVICLAWLSGISALVLTQEPLVVNNHNSPAEFTIPKPDLKQVEGFNLLIQNRFLTAPGFGIVRIQPTPPYSNHLSSFNSINEFEKKAVEDFERDGWKVGLYLFGKTAGRKFKNGLEQKEFLIEYKLKQPVIITKNIKKREELVNAGRMLKQVKEAFSIFQAAGINQEKSFEFKIGSWWYLAKPVRAVNESCITCHADYVVQKKLDDGKYQFRPRKVGDVNGILVYSFQKVKK